MKRAKRDCIERKRKEQAQRVNKLITRVVKFHPGLPKKGLTDEVVSLSGLGWHYVWDRIDSLVELKALCWAPGEGLEKCYYPGRARLEERSDEGTDLTIQDLFREYREKWKSVGQWQDPDLVDCLDWMATEVGEAIDARLRLTLGYTRNNPRVSTRDDVATEIVDVIMMGCTALDLLGLDLFDVARRKLEEMDAKRSGSREEVDLTTQVLANLERQLTLNDIVPRPIGELVLTDLERRLEFGREKYGGDLLPFDDTVDPLLDAYEEALDLSLYLRQAIEEKRLLQGGYKPGDLPKRSVDES